MVFSFNLDASDYGSVFSADETLSERWKQVYPLAKNMTPFKANDFLSKCVESKDWFLQLAALKSYEVLMPRQGLKKAKSLLKSSPSLIVRSETVNYIKKHGNINDVPLLFGALLSSENFKGRRSLSIRPLIIDAIESMDTQNIYKKRWSKLKHDSNLRVRKMARKRSNPTNL